jgi:DNA-binding IclR family transcriptional regulator
VVKLRISGVRGNLVDGEQKLQQASHDDAPRASIRAVHHTAELLRRISESRKPLGINELARRVGIDKSSVSRLVATLEREYLVARDPGTGRISLGLGLVAIVAPALVDLGIESAVRPVLSELARDTGETASFSVWDGSHAVSVEQVAGAGAVRAFSEPGRRDQGHCSAAGKMLLAHAGKQAIADYCSKPLERLTPRTITDPVKLRAELESARARGYAINTGESEIDVGAVSSVVRDRNGRVFGTLTVTVPIYRFPAARQEQMAALARRAATKLGHLLPLV